MWGRQFGSEVVLECPTRLYLFKNLFDLNIALARGNSPNLKAKVTGSGVLSLKPGAMAAGIPGMGKAGRVYTGIYRRYGKYPVSHSNPRTEREPFFKTKLWFERLYQPTAAR